MKENSFRYTKFGLINALLSLIPIFPVWTLFPGVIFGEGLGNLINNCELGYNLTLVTCFGALTFLLNKHLKKSKVESDKSSERQLKWDFRVLSLAIYTLINSAVLIIILGANSVCHGGGQTIMACIISGPISSMGLIILGAATDLKNKKKYA